MAADKRKKGCPNEECERHQKKIKLKATEEYCPKCGAKLIFVCAKCFREIEDLDPKHRICKLCEAKKDEKRAEVVNKAKKGGQKVAAKAVEIAAPVGNKIGNKLIKGVQNEAINRGSKAINNIFHKRGSK